MTADGQDRGGLRAGGELGQMAAMSALFTGWLAGDKILGTAGTELRDCLAPSSAPAAGTPAGRAPAWSAEAWLEGWSAALLEDQPDEAARAAVAGNIAALRTGQAEVVVTGQQPGLLGGPLYTLLKVATVVALARQRSAAGRLTVPLFWSGDDDDDLAEALVPVIYDPARETLLRADGYEDVATGTAAMVGTLAAQRMEAGSAAWLAEQAGRNPLAAALAGLWQEAMSTDLSWGRLQRKALAQTFAGSGLLMVSGNDGALHRVAEPLYRRIWDRRADWSAAVGAGGETLRGANFHAQIRATAAAGFLRRADGDTRLPVAMEPGTEMPPAEQIRPGVACRAAVQDWLFAPAAVVVGPAEVAYLKQLEPAYGAFAIPRAPLVPRLFAQLVPADLPAAAVPAAATDASTGAGSEVVARAAAQVTAAAGAALGEALMKVGGTEDERARRLATEHTRRWLRGITALLGQEEARNAERSRPALPLWLSPGTEAQERLLASHCATALWGRELVDQILTAADQHLNEGQAGRWQRYQLLVPEP